MHLTLGSGAQRVPADWKGDFALSVFEGGTAWRNLHNELRDALLRFAHQVGLRAEPEYPKLLDTKDGRPSRSKPADVLVEGQHGWRPAQGRNLWIDVTTISAVCATHVALAAKEIGAAAAHAALQKLRKYHAQMAAKGFTGYLLPIAFESEGYASKELSLLLKV